MMRHFPFPIVASHGLAWLQKWTVIGACHHWCIKALRHIRNNWDIASSERWQQQLQRSFSASGIIRGYHVYNMDTSEKATMVREPGNEHDRVAVAVLKDEMLCTFGHFFLVIPDLSLFTSLVVQRWVLWWYRKRRILWELVVVCNTHFRLASLRLATRYTSHK